VSIAVPTKTAVRSASLVRRAGENIIGNTSARDESVAGLGGDIGARDATPGEIESGFNAKSIGEADTEHMLKVPEGIREVTELVNRSCVALDGSEGTLDDEAQKLVYQKQVADWKIRMVDGHEVLRREYRTANADDAKEVINRLNTVAVSFFYISSFFYLRMGNLSDVVVCSQECESKTVDSFVEGPGVRIEIWSKAVNGLHINDFILAAKIDQLDLSDKVTKKPPNVFLI
jgi:4a-hydroxytetrahydrobiopterin dehydratase